MRRRVAIALVTLAGACGGDAPAPPVLTEVAPFELVDDQGQPFRSEALRGEVWIANFVFTTCPSVCPLLTTQMRNVRADLEGTGVRYVSFSVDPENDRPEVLRAYRERMDARGDDWSFVTGEREAVRAAVEEQMRVSMGAREGGDIMHAVHFVLVDRTGHIRGFYLSSTEGLADLRRDARTIAE